MEEAYRLCSHNFEGLTVDAAAVKMGITANSIRDLLSDMKRVAPQLFPILTPVERSVLILLDAHIKVNEIMAGLNLGRQTVDRIIVKLKTMGEIKSGRRPVAYSAGMDSKVVDRF